MHVRLSNRERHRLGRVCLSFLIVAIASCDSSAGPIGPNEIENPAAAATADAGPLAERPDEKADSALSDSSIPGHVCGEGELECAGECIDVAISRDHCGGCGLVCDGVCCDGECADVATSRDHCGACGVVCDGTCEAGACVPDTRTWTSRELYRRRVGFETSIAVGPGDQLHVLVHDDGSYNEFLYATASRSEAAALGADAFDFEVIAEGGEYSDMQVASDGTVHIAFVGAAESWSDQPLVYGEKRGAAWTFTELAHGVAGSVEMELDSRGRPHVVFMTPYGDTKEVGYATRTSEWQVTSIWTETGALTEGRAGVAIAVDEDYRAHFAYANAWTAEAGRELELRYGTFDLTGIHWEVLTNLQVGPSVALELDDDGRPIVLSWDWYDDLRSFEQGPAGTWTDELVERRDLNTGIYVASTSHNGTTHATYVSIVDPRMSSEGQLLQYAVQTGTGWLYQTAFELPAEIKYPAIALDSDGDPHIVVIAADSLRYFYLTP